MQCIKKSACSKTNMQIIKCTKPYKIIIELIFNFRNSFGQFLLHTDIALTLDHNSLCLRGACTMHRFCSVTNSSSTKCQVFNQTENAQTVFCRNLVNTFQVFFNVSTKFWISEIFFRWSCNHQTTGDILSETCDLIRETGNILFTYIRKKKVDQIVA